MSPHYIYLVSDGLCIRAVRGKPDDVTLVDGRWFVRSFDFALGQAITVYTDGIWKGTVGVYDENDPVQLIQAFDDLRAHTLALLDRRLEPKMCEIMGQRATDDLWAVRCAGGGERLVPSENGSLLLRMSEKVKGLCYRGE
jgi:hypothetical protein